MTTTSQGQSDKLPGTVFTPRQVRLLKIAVIVMGIALVGGFFLVIGVIVYQASSVGESDARPAVAQEAAPVVGEAALSLAAGESISHIALDGSRLAIHVIGPGVSEIRVIDLATGTVVSRIKLKRE
ncbi:MAG: hypothetical protein OEM91_02785 [Hyphomicrobiales bacterium]|nr:hypothetical protein [Hyphomicrobiales bacterium]